MRGMALQRSKQYLNYGEENRTKVLIAERKTAWKMLKKSYYSV
jgi:hypothetical protein